MINSVEVSISDDLKTFIFENADISGTKEHDNTFSINVQRKDFIYEEVKKILLNFEDIMIFNLEHFKAILISYTYPDSFSTPGSTKDQEFIDINLIFQPNGDLHSLYEWKF